MLINDNDYDYRDAEVDSKLNISLYVYKKREECERNREGKKNFNGEALFATTQVARIQS